MYESRNETSTFEIWVKLKAVNFKQICNLIWYFHQIQLLWIFQADKMSSHLVRPDQDNKLEGMMPIKPTTKAYAVGYDSNMSSSQLVRPVQDILEDMKPSHTVFFLYFKKGASFIRKLFGNLRGKVWALCTQNLKKIAPSPFEISAF